jgi:DNA-binding transcriptional LysR family regulator
MRIETPDLRQLATFVAVARTGSFSAAAHRLNTTQPAVSNRIRELENSLGVRLFERTTRSCHLTAKGRSLIAYADRIFALTSELRSDISQTADLSGLVKIGIPEPVALTWLPSLLIALAQRAPKLEIDVEVGLSLELLPKLHTLDLDLACIAGPASLAGIVSEQVGHLHLAWLASPMLQLPQLPLTPQILTEHAFLVHEGSRHWPPIEQWFRDAGCWPRNVVRCNSIPALIKLAVAGLGLSVFPISAASDEIAAGLLRVVPSAAALPNNPFMVVYAERRLDAATQVVISTTKEVAAQHMLNSLTGAA